MSFTQTDVDLCSSRDDQGLKQPRDSGSEDTIAQDSRQAMRLIFLADCHEVNVTATAPGEQLRPGKRHHLILWTMNEKRPTTLWKGALPGERNSRTGQEQRGTSPASLSHQSEQHCAAKRGANEKPRNGFLYEPGSRPLHGHQEGALHFAHKIEGPSCSTSLSEHLPGDRRVEIHSVATKSFSEPGPLRAVGATFETMKIDHLPLSKKGAQSITKYGISREHKEGPGWNRQREKRPRTGL